MDNNEKTSDEIIKDYFDDVAKVEKSRPHVLNGTEKIISSKQQKADIELAKLEVEKGIAVREDKTAPSLDVMQKSITPQNVMTQSLMTTEVKFTPIDYETMNDKKIAHIRKSNVDNYHLSIKNNYVIGAKAVYLICRDLSEAHKNLPTEDYATLIDLLPISESRISKYLTIGGSTYLKEIMLAGKMPDSWTTQYKLASLMSSKNTSEEVKRNIKEMVSVDMTADDIDNVTNPKSDDDKKSRVGTWTEYTLDKPKEFLKIAFENNSDFADVDPNTLMLIKNRVEQVVQDSLKEMKMKNLDYYVSKEARDVKVEVLVDENVFIKTTEKIINFIKKKMVGKTKDSYLLNFLNKQKEVNGKLSTPLEA